MKKLLYCLFGNRMHNKCHTNVQLTDQKLYVCVCLCVLGHQLFNSNRVQKPFNLFSLIYSITEVLNCNIKHSNNAKKNTCLRSFLNLIFLSLCLFFSPKRKNSLSLKLFSLFKTFLSLYKLFFLFCWRQNVLERKKNVSKKVRENLRPQEG